MMVVAAINGRRKTGTIYYFWAPTTNPSCYGAGYLGRLYQIIGRNHNNYITFAYTWATSGEPPYKNLTQIDATTATVKR